MSVSWLLSHVHDDAGEDSSRTAATQLRGVLGLLHFEDGLLGCHETICRVKWRRARPDSEAGTAPVKIKAELESCTGPQFFCVFSESLAALGDSTLTHIGEYQTMIKETDRWHQTIYSMFESLSQFQSYFLYNFKWMTQHPNLSLTPRDTRSLKQQTG